MKKYDFIKSYFYYQFNSIVYSLKKKVISINKDF